MAPLAQYALELGGGGRVMCMICSTNIADYGPRVQQQMQEVLPPSHVHQPLVVKKRVEEQLSKTVRWSSLWQTSKGLATAGPYKASVYAARKILKRFRL